MKASKTVQPLPAGFVARSDLVALTATVWCSACSATSPCRDCREIMTGPAEDA